MVRVLLQEQPSLAYERVVQALLLQRDQELVLVVGGLRRCRGLGEGKEENEEPLGPAHAVPFGGSVRPGGSVAGHFNYLRS